MTTLGKAVATAGLAAALLVPVSVAAPAGAATHFANCTAMHHVYQHGVARSAAAATHQVRMGYGRPVVKPAVYAANRGSDRDGDGTACEA
jgi:hypothetical protein